MWSLGPSAVCQVFPPSESAVPCSHICTNRTGLRVAIDAKHMKHTSKHILKHSDHTHTHTLVLVSDICPVCHQHILVCVLSYILYL